ITATSEGQSGTAALTIAAASCVISSGAWQNVAIPSQAGAFEAQFDAIPTTANMNGVVGLSNGPAADWTNLAAIVRFDSAGTIDARNVSVSPWTPPQPAPVASVTVSPAATSVSVGATVQLTATLKDASGNVLTGRSLTWASSTLGMATVSTGGLVTGVAVGAATITAT